MKMSSKALDIKILKPPTLWIDKRCYRVLTPNVSSSCINYAQEDSYPEHNAYKDELECKMEGEMEFQVEHLQNGKVKTSFHVASTYLPYLVGSKGSTKMRVEDATHTNIRIPPKGMTGDIVVIGNDTRTVRQARLKLELLVQQARKKQPVTHFLSIPLTTDSFQQKFLHFKEDVLAKFGGRRGVDDSIFQDPKKLHVTLGVFVLVDDKERQDAIEAIKQTHPHLMNYYICDEPMRIEVKGVSYMNDDPSEIDVLYGDIQVVTWNHNLQDMCDDLISKLHSSKVAVKQYERVKLHATLMNTRFRRDDDGTEDRVTERARESFDGKDILEEYKEYLFGELEVSEIHLSIRHATAASGYYSSSIKLPLVPTR